MTTREALEFLKEHQPMPSDDELSQDLIERYEEVRAYLVEHPDERCIPLLLGSFGEGDGFGVYQLVEDVISQFSHDRVVDHLVAALSSSGRSCRYWSAEIAALFPDEQLVGPLISLLDEEDEDLNAAAIIALGQIGSHESVTALQRAVSGKRSEHLKTLAEEQLEAMPKIW